MSQRLRPVLPAGSARAASWPLHDLAASRALEAAATETLPPYTLMQRAGAAVARLAMAVAPHAPRLWVAAGPGNNGGDGLEAALQLQIAGKAVAVSLYGEAARLPADARTALERCQAAGVRIEPGGVERPAGIDAETGAALAVDALLGLGSSRAPAGLLAQGVAQLRRWRGPVLAVDLPTGLDAGSGQALGGDIEACVRADHTLALLTLKPGLFTGHGRDLAGRVWFDDLGVAPGDGATAELRSGSTGLHPRRTHAQHKGSFGDVLVLGGAPGMSGAALLAARAALAAGAGRVYACPLDEALPPLDAGMPELMFRRVEAARRMDWQALTLVCGCGGGEAVRAVLPQALSRGGRLVLDADALNALAADPSLQRLLQARSARGLPTVLTPHPLEAGRLLQCSAAEVQAQRLEAAAELARRHGCVVVLKGSGSIVAAPGAPTAVNASGNAALATAGTGDVLAGWLGGLWSQGLEVRDAALLAVFEHGTAADRWLSRVGTTGPLPASQLIRELAAGSRSPGP
ncbi:NAD(P)H-hydrate dehydratase [Aquabacterium sp. A7-Y]|uniref:NAD(P)H-hydrate dehydratase n=1 Tax=Aquabacterium sp. A7-Y TaxID=1349605 RepID=UPI00223DC3BD|nr:NAD(P)H-hydrate dehydratase [Aquabacterium sp. A7-Y]MCW7540326.1 NAD(P)H-hydrate dehydratase [Aquabacterium sp. A7-Y]